MFRATGGEGDVKVRSERGFRWGVLGALAAAGMCLMLVAARGQAAAAGGQAPRSAQAEQAGATSAAKPALIAGAQAGATGRGQAAATAAGTKAGVAGQYFKKRQGLQRIPVGGFL